MELTHSFTVPAPVDVAWATFMDLREVGSCFPGATVTDADEHGFSGQVKVKLGPIAMVYQGTGTFAERDESAHRAVIEARGKDRRGNGTAGATATIRLAPVDPGTTKVDVTTDLQITGRPAQFGRGVMQDVSDTLLGRFVECIEGKLSGSAAPAAASAPATDAGRPAAASAGVPEASPAPAAPTRSPGTAAMFGATAGADSWEARRAEPASRAPAGPAAASAVPTGKTGAAGDTDIADDTDDAIDLGATVVPVLLRSHGREIAIGALAFVVGWKLGRLLPG